MQRYCLRWRVINGDDCIILTCVRSLDMLLACTITGDLVIGSLTLNRAIWSVCSQMGMVVVYHHQA